MNRKQKHVVAMILILALTVPPHTSSAATGAKTSPKERSALQTRSGLEVVDIALTKDGRLRGVVVSPQGRPVAASQILLRKQGKTVSKSKSGKHGTFSFSKVRSGTYELETRAGICRCRIWTNRAAPPAAVPAVMIVDGKTLVRGQHSMNEFFTGDPVLLGSIVAAAIIIPIAIHEARDDSPSGS